MTGITRSSRRLWGIVPDKLAFLRDLETRIRDRRAARG